MTNQAKFRYWCHFRATITEEGKEGVRVEGAVGISRPIQITTFEDVQDMVAAIANIKAQQHPKAKVSVLLFGWTALDNSPLLLPPGVH
jgi:hypothetical protein